jgi:hypothetical protein
MQIAKADTSYTLVSLQGPPGNASIFQVVGDRAHIVWNLGRDLMYVDLRAPAIRLPVSGTSATNRVRSEGLGGADRLGA